MDMASIAKLKGWCGVAGSRRRVSVSQGSNDALAPCPPFDLQTSLENLG